MAKSKNNVVTKVLPGKVDLLVSRQKNGDTIVGTRPRKSATVVTRRQMAKAIFQQAVIYARAAIADPSLKQAYREKTQPGQTAYNLAVADFLFPPEIGEIDVSSYTGQPGNTITIPVTDDFKVVAVKVKIENPDRSLAERGRAILQADGLHWMYTCKKDIASLAGTIITVTATDMPRHPTTKQKVM